ncbi:MAG: cupin domain-containing protein [Chloroflexota bacterium]|nr:cupin domain-containing protein [Chloroflexota bacterium]
MPQLQKGSFDAPDETRDTSGKGRLDVVRLEGLTATRATYQPGWRWSTHVKPLVGTDSCQVLHLGTVLSGRLHVVMDDGSEADAGPGDVYVVPPGHDAWVVGEEPLTFVDVSPEMSAYAKA